MYKIKHVTKFLVDVFHGDGFGNCARLRKEQGQWKILKTWGKVPKTVINGRSGGIKMTYSQWLEQNLPYTYGQFKRSPK